VLGETCSAPRTRYRRGTMQEKRLQTKRTCIAAAAAGALGLLALSLLHAFAVTVARCGAA
jgi:hypothetical protein